MQDEPISDDEADNAHVVPQISKKKQKRAVLFSRQKEVNVQICSW